jgi:hypothetical protein
MNSIYLLDANQIFTRNPINTVETISFTVILLQQTTEYL